MICPSCGYDNVPGADECAKCLADLAPFDRPTAQDRVESSLMQDRVKSLNPRSPITVPAAAPLGLALQTMIDSEVGAVLVTGGDDQLVGVLTERDFLNKVAGRHPNFHQLPVAQFMTAHPETIGPEDTLAFALHKMDIGGYRHLPVVEGGRPVGMLSVRAIIRHITRICKEA